MISSIINLKESLGVDWWSNLMVWNKSEWLKRVLILFYFFQFNSFIHFIKIMIMTESIHIHINSNYEYSHHLEIYGGIFLFHTILLLLLFSRKNNRMSKKEGFFKRKKFFILILMNVCPHSRYTLLSWMWQTYHIVLLIN